MGMKNTNITYEQSLRELFAELSHTSDLFVAMSQTVENSPWHREANVLVHTGMVLEEYIKLTNSLRKYSDWLYEDWLGGISCIWHDAGKPAARTPKFSEERGNYFAYHGHELISARLFENWAIKSGKFAPKDIFMVEWMIAHHMPWATTKADKLAQLKATCLAMGGDEMLSVYIRALLADQFGRIADDKEAKDAASMKWVSQLLDAADHITPGLATLASDKFLVMPIGPSGAGKSTLWAELSNDPGAAFQCFSLDKLRHEWYDPIDYSNAYAKSVDDNEFASKANARFIELIKTGANVYVDNTNLSTKRRAFYLAEAKRRGYKTIAYHLLVTLDDVIKRQQTRIDKTVPEHAVRQQYMSLTVPSIGEFDEIIIK